MARERDCVSISYHYPVRKRVCVFFLRFLNNDGQAFCHKPSHVEIKDNKRHAAEKNNGACQNHMTY
jgi:hypothetical protein